MPLLDTITAAPPLLIALLVVAASFALGLYRRRTPQPVAASASADAPPTTTRPAKDRAFGAWTPAAFRYPPIAPSTALLAEVPPIPYRPFRYGPYHVTMGLRAMEWNDWIELDRGHAQYHRVKAHRLTIRKGAGAPVRVLPDSAKVKGGALGALEVVHELCEYLSRRYPRDFVVERHTARVVGGPGEAFCDWGWDGQPAVRRVTIVALGVSYDVPLSVDDGERAAERALEVAGLLVQDDLIVMVEGHDGIYYFQAGSVTLPGFWRMQDKIGMPLDEIHISGHVPQCWAHKERSLIELADEEKLATSLGRFFRRLPVDKPMVRNNYFFQSTPADGADGVDTEELGWAESMVGEEDAFRAMGGHRTMTEETQERVDVGRLRMRSERQTVRRLPQSGAVLFTVRTYLTPVVELGKEEGVPERLAAALRSWPRDVGEYKGQFRGGWFDAVVEYMEDVRVPDMARH